MPETTIDNAFLASIFPPEKTDAFFNALFGDAEDGAYTIVLAMRKQADDHVDLAFELHQRNNSCLRCNLTYGLPKVFERHPVIDAGGTAAKVAEKLGWSECTWSLGSTQEVSEAMHWIPFRITRKG